MLNDMEKTIQEIKDAVLAECERRDSQDDCMISATIFVEKRGDVDFVIYKRNSGQQWGIANISKFSLQSDIEAAYILLGLEARDAVAELTKEKDHWQADCGKYIERLTDAESANHRLNAELKAERAKSAKLVEALGTVVSICEPDKVANLSAETLSNKIDRVASRYLEAYKKGGGNVG